MLSVTANSTVSPSSAVASAIDNSGNASPLPVPVSSSMIVPVPVSSRNVAPFGALNSTVNASSDSANSSSIVATPIVARLSPAKNVSVPVAAV